jgi:hypothetical protein
MDKQHTLLLHLERIHGFHLLVLQQFLLQCKQTAGRAVDPVLYAVVVSFSALVAAVGVAVLLRTKTILAFQVTQL